MPPVEDPNVLVGTSTSDDAAAYRLEGDSSQSGQAIIQTVDFITPIVDDPFEFGRIAAANSLSDVYAMGGRPLFALNIVCFPSKQVPLEVLGEILRGGVDAAREAGIEIVGGHSVEDSEPKYGLIVTGIAAADRVITNSGAKAGDVLFLTKPLGSGILTTAMKKGRVEDADIEAVIRVMRTLNRSGAAAIDGLEVHAMTDVTGFGLLGHLLEMMQGARLTARLQLESIPILSQVIELAEEKVYPGGASRNRKRSDPHVQWSASIGEAYRVAINDPQTSGGLLIAVAPGDADELHRRLRDAETLAAARIGEVIESSEKSIYVEGTGGMGENSDGG